ncbi:Kinesin-like protein KIN-13A [Fusarium oxysporum f. sp. albedinis]|nr:Kinesin-like protein KIN-13A [Fusarium oxysporum f. sp. albedinis]
MDMCLLISHLTLPRHSKFIQTLSQSCLSHALLFLAIPGVPSEYCQPGNSNLCPCPCKHLALIATAVASTESSAEETTKATPKATGITLFWVLTNATTNARLPHECAATMSHGPPPPPPPPQGAPHPNNFNNFYGFNLDIGSLPDMTGGQVNYHSPPRDADAGGCGPIYSAPLRPRPTQP